MQLNEVYDIIPQDSKHTDITVIQRKTTLQSP